MPASQTFSFKILPTLRNLIFCLNLACQYSDITTIVSLASFKGTQDPLAISCSASDVGGLLLLGSFSPVRGRTSLSPPPHSPAKMFPIYLFRIMFSWKRWVVTLLYFLAKRKQVHFISIERTLKSCHLEGKNRKYFRNAKDLIALTTADLQEQILFFDSEQVMMLLSETVHSRSCSAITAVLHTVTGLVPGVLPHTSQRLTVLARKRERAESQQQRGAPPATQHPVPIEDAAVPVIVQGSCQALAPTLLYSARLRCRPPSLPPTGATHDHGTQPLGSIEPGKVSMFSCHHDSFCPKCFRCGMLGV